jgi:tRNA threonylcarbamoyl adenosine modification protein (Sua5/YciO/YrdC/YwlC family)
MTPATSARARILKAGVSDAGVPPSPSVIKAGLEVLRKGGVLAFPTDTLYGIGCAVGRPRAIERIQAMRAIDRATRPLTFLLPDVGELARYAEVSATAHRILNRIFPGPYCVELVANSSVPDPFVVGLRRTIGVRIPDHALCEKLLWGLEVPLLTATAKSPEGRVLTTAKEVEEVYGDKLDLIVDGGTLPGPASTVVTLVDDWVTVLRQGKGPAAKLRG